MKKEWNRIHIPKSLSQQTKKGMAKAKQEEQRQKFRPLRFVGIVAALFLLIATTRIKQVTAYSEISNIPIILVIIILASSIILYHILGHAFQWFTVPLILLAVALYLFSMPYRPASPLPLHAKVIYTTNDGKEANNTKVELKVAQALGEANVKRIKAIHIGHQTLTKQDFVFTFTYEAFRQSEIQKAIWQRDEKISIDRAVNTLAVEWHSGKTTQVPLTIMYEFPSSTEGLIKHPTEDQHYTLAEATTITAFIPGEAVAISHLQVEGSTITAEQLPITLEKGSVIEVNLVQQPEVHLQQPTLPLIKTTNNHYEIVYLDEHPMLKQQKYEEAIKKLLQGVSA